MESEFDDKNTPLARITGDSLEIPALHERLRERFRESSTLSEGGVPPVEDTSPRGIFEEDISLNPIVKLGPVHTYEDKNQNVISLIDSECIPCITTDKTKNYLYLTDKGEIQEVLNPSSTIKKITLGYEDPNLGPNGEIFAPDNYQVFAFQTRSMSRGIVNPVNLVATRSGGRLNSHSTSFNSAAVSLNDRVTRIPSLSKSRDGTQDDYRFIRETRTPPEDVFETLPGDLETRSEIQNLMKTENYRRAASEQSDYQSCLPNKLRSKVMAVLREGSHKGKQLKKLKNLRTKVIAAMKASYGDEIPNEFKTHYDADVKLESNLGKIIESINIGDGNDIAGPSNKEVTIPTLIPTSEVTPEVTPEVTIEKLILPPIPTPISTPIPPPGVTPGVSETKEGIHEKAGSSNPNPKAKVSIGGVKGNIKDGAGPSNPNPEDTPDIRASDPASDVNFESSATNNPEGNLDPPYHVEENPLTINESNDYIKFIPLGIHWNTAIGRIKLNPNVVTNINYETGLPDKLKFGIDFNIVPNTPITERISIHQGNGSGLHHGVEASMKNTLLNIKAELGTTDSKNYWEASGKVNLSKITAVQSRIDNIKQYLPPELGKYWRTPSVGFGFGSNQSLKNQQIKDIQNLFIDMDIPLDSTNPLDNGGISFRLPLINKQVDFNEQIRLVREVAGMYGNPSIIQIQQMSRLATLMNNPLVSNVATALSLRNNSGAGSESSARIINENLNQIRSQVDSLNIGGNNTRTLVEQGIRNQGNILREVRDSNEADCCDELIARLNRVESKLDTLLDPIKETDSPLENLAGGLLLGTAIYFTKNLVITVIISLSVGLVGGVINYHVIRITRKAQIQQWPSYPFILLIRVSFTIFSMATTIILIGNLFNNAVTAQPPLTEIPILREIPFLQELLHPKPNGYKGVQWYLHKLPSGSHQFLTIAWHKFGAVSLIGFQLVGVFFIFIRISKGGDVSKMFLETIAVLIIQAKSVTVSNYIQQQDRDIISWNDLPGFFNVSIIDLFKYYTGLGTIVINSFKRNKIEQDYYN